MDFRAAKGCVTSVMLSRDRCKDYRKSAKQQPELFSGEPIGLQVYYDSKDVIWSWEE